MQMETMAGQSASSARPSQVSSGRGNLNGPNQPVAPVKRGRPRKNLAGGKNVGEVVNVCSDSEFERMAHKMGAVGKRKNKHEELGGDGGHAFANGAVVTG